MDQSRDLSNPLLERQSLKTSPEMSYVQKHKTENTRNIINTRHKPTENQSCTLEGGNVQYRKLQMM